jgi:hypothetical protein
VVVGKLDAGWTLLGPDEADAELIVHADRVLALAVALEGLQSIARRGSQILQRHGRLEVLKLSARNLEQIGRKALLGFALEGCFSLRVFEAPDHKTVCIML